MFTRVTTVLGRIFTAIFTVLGVVVLVFVVGSMRLKYGCTEDEMRPEYTMGNILIAAFTGVSSCIDERQNR